VLNVKICSIQYPERYVIRRMVVAAQNELQAEIPGLEVEIVELADPGQIGKYAFVLILPTLVINEIVVCSGRFPAKKEVRDWLSAAALIDAGKRP
jgi:Thioredoxin domain